MLTAPFDAFWSQHRLFTRLHFDSGTRCIRTFGGVDPFAPGGLSAPHGLCVDAQGDLYVAEVTWTDGGRKGIYPEGFHTFLKLSGRT